MTHGVGELGGEVVGLVLGELEDELELVEGLAHAQEVEGRVHLEGPRGREQVEGAAQRPEVPVHVLPDAAEAPQRVVQRRREQLRRHLHGRWRGSWIHGLID